MTVERDTDFSIFRLPVNTVNISETMSAHHRQCDEKFVNAEAVLAKGEWEKAEADFAAFRLVTEKHFSMEEDILFPEFESRTGQTSGPTQMMRSEHMQMRQLFDDVSQAIRQRDRHQALGLTETLMMIMQQHNMKEEQILYPMIDQVVGAQADKLLESMDLS